MASKTKCPLCRGCMSYRMINNKSYYWCDLCQSYYRILPGNVLEKVIDNSIEKPSITFRLDE